MRAISKINHGLVVLFLFFLMSGCNSSSNDGPPAVYTEEATEFTEDKNATAPMTEDGDSNFALKNTSTFHTVEIKQMKFQPSELRVHKGDTVLWINKDITDHDVTEKTKKAWTSSKLELGKSWSKVVNESAEYYCSMHVVMKGKLIVE